MKALLYFDGASTGNPGPSGAGWVINDSKGVTIKKGNKFLGDQTNNFAEYHGLILGMEAAKECGIKDLIVVGDSNLVISQVNGKFKVKTESLIPLFSKAKELQFEFKSIEFHWIPREENQWADRESNQAIEKHFEEQGGVLGSILNKHGFQK